MKLSKNELTLKLIDLLKDFTADKESLEIVKLQAFKDSIRAINLVLVPLKAGCTTDVINLDLVEMFNNHTVLRFPLKDKINSLYDDMEVTYTFNKELVLEGSYMPLNIELLTPNLNNTIPVVENIVFNKHLKNDYLLDTKFCDFKNLTLEDLDELNPEIRKFLRDKVK